MVTLKIRVTKEVLQRSRFCSPESESLSKSCAIALAVKDIFPYAQVGQTNIKPFRFIPGYYEWQWWTIQLPPEAQAFIKIFDCSDVLTREGMDELEFEIELSDDIIEKIDIKEITTLLENHPTLQLTA